MSINPLELRNAFGSFATGVTVVTANPEGFAPFGMTVNSFSSLSLDPPLLLWSLQNNSECWDAFVAAEQFAINILAEHQQDLSSLYAKKGQHDLQAEHFEIGPSGVAVLNDSLARFECRVEERLAGGDHTIYVGRVEHLRTTDHERPVVFYAGQYRQLSG